MGRRKKTQPVEQTAEKPQETVIQEVKRDPNELLNAFLSQYKLQLDFDVINGPVQTTHGIIKLTEPTLVVKASYVE